jgi:hypothetical protein
MYKMSTNVACKRLFRLLFDSIARYEGRAAVLKRHNIPAQYYNKVINENEDVTRTYRAPADWIVDLTNHSKNYSAMEGLAALTGGVYLSPDQVDAIVAVDPDRLIDIIKSLTTIVRAQKEGRDE